MYIRGIIKDNKEKTKRKGFWIAVLEYNGRKKTIYGAMDATNENGRVVTTAIIEGLKLLKEPCLVNLYTHTGFFRRDKESIKNNDYTFRPVGTHRDMLEIIDNLLKDGSHELNVIITEQYQYQLSKLLKKIREDMNFI